MKHFTIFACDQFKTEPGGGMARKTNCAGQDIFLDRRAPISHIREVAAYLVQHFRCVDVFVGKDPGKLYWTNSGPHQQPIENL